jgi:tetratricopeptide (TPR) repeat protein
MPPPPGRTPTAVTSADQHRDSPEGDLDGAKTQVERALTLDEAAYGSDHPDVATDRNNLGNVLQDLGDLNGAKTQYERALMIFQAAYGPDHPRVTTGRNNLASLRDHPDSPDGSTARKL